MTTLAFALPRRTVRVPVPTRRRAKPSRGPGCTTSSLRRPPRRLGPRARGTDSELRSFAGAAGAIAVAFVLALAYLAGSTGVASAGYESQRLAAERDELRRQNALLELELAKLDSPARIEAEAKRLGLVRLAFIPVVQATTLTARR